MKKNNTDNNEALRNLLNALHEPVSEVDGMTPEQVRIYLAEHGFETDKLHRMLQQRVAAVEGRLRLQRASAQYQQIGRNLSQVGTKIAAAVGETKEEVLRRLQRMESNQPDLAAAMFRKFEEADDTDYRALYEDLIRLDELAGDEPSE